MDLQEIFARIDAMLELVKQQETELIAMQIAVLEICQEGNK